MLLQTIATNPSEESRSARASRQAALQQHVTEQLRPNFRTDSFSAQTGPLRKRANKPAAESTEHLVNLARV